MSSSTESWRQSLATIRAQLSDLTASDTPLAGVYGVYSPDPMRQQQDLPQVDDFRELSLGPVFRRKEDVSPRVLHQDQRKVEALYYTSDVWASRYPEIATGLLNIVFRDEEHARQLLGFTGVSDVTPVDLWTILLFRLATQRLDGTGLFPRNSANAGDVYQTLWPVATKGPNACDPISLPDGPSPSPLWLPQIYYGSLWVLNEARGTILLEPHSEQPVNLTECTLRFSPPLVLFGTSHTNKQPPQLPPLFYYAWGGAQGEFPTVAVLNADGSHLPDFDAKRVCGIRTCFLSSAGAADDYGNGYYCSQDRPDVSASLSGSAGIFEVKRDYPLAKITTTRFEIPLNINFLACDEAENVRLVIWPQDPVENRSIGYHYFSDENLCMPDLQDCLSFQPSPGEYFVLKNFPLLQTKYNNSNCKRKIAIKIIHC